MPRRRNQQAAASPRHAPETASIPPKQAGAHQPLAMTKLAKKIRQSFFLQSLSAKKAKWQGPIFIQPLRMKLQTLWHLDSI
jgi:hypothetical protein